MVALNDDDAVAYVFAELLAASDISFFAEHDIIGFLKVCFFFSVSNFFTTKGDGVLLCIYIFNLNF